MRALAIISLMVVSLTGLWGATEYVAARLDDAPELGPPWATPGDFPIYPPWGWVLWDRRYGSLWPATFRNASAITTVAALAGTALAALLALQRKSSGSSGAHGTSRWATTLEI